MRMCGTGYCLQKDEKEEEATAYTSKSSGKYLLETSVKMKTE